MPPKAKYTKGQMIEVALELVKEKGMKALTAREFAKKLGTSSCPIFTVFSSMEEVQQEVIHAARMKYNQYTLRGLKEDLAFKGVGKGYVRFAKEEPVLFQLLFMTQESGGTTLEGMLKEDDNYEKILASIVNVYHLSQEVAHRLYLHLWIYTHGIATLIATGMCQLSESEVDEMLTETFIGLLVKSKQKNS